MKAIEYLKQIEKLDKQINRKIEMAEDWRMMACNISANKIKERYNVSRSNGATFEEFLAKADALEKEADNDIDALVDLKKKVEGTISQIDDKNCRRVLLLRYVELLKWEKVIEYTGLSRTHTFRKHNEGIEQLEIMLSKIFLMEP